MQALETTSHAEVELPFLWQLVKGCTFVNDVPEPLTLNILAGVLVVQSIFVEMHSEILIMGSGAFHKLALVQPSALL